MVGQAIKLAATGRRVSVNLSATTLHNAALINTFVSRLPTAPLAARNITFEITETAVMIDLAAATDFCLHMSECGTGVELDDFGTGYGSLTDLRNLKLNGLKIDMSFVRNMVTSEKDQHVVRIIIQLAKDFGLTTTAEGVEDAATLEMLRDYGADYAQGYLLSRPKPVRTTS